MTSAIFDAALQNNMEKAAENGTQNAIDRCSECSTGEGDGKIVIVDYGVGNLFSLKSSLAAIGQQAIASSDEAVLARAERLILPGVGAFGDAADKLRASGLFSAVQKAAAAGKPILGICLGMQLLLEKSEEYGMHTGLGLIQGNVRPIADVIGAEYKIPQIGWNALIFPKDRPVSRLYRYIHEGDYVYFVHSFYATDCDEAVSAVDEYGAMLTASVECGNVYGTQFHPEKSGTVGLHILRAFCEI